MTENRGKIATISTFITTANTIYNIASSTKTKWEETHNYRAAVNGASYVYEPMLVWLNETINPKRIAFKSTKSGIEPLFDASGHATLMLNGHKLKVEIEKPESRKAQMRDEDYEAIMADNIIFTSRTRAGIEALQSKLDELTSHKRFKTKEIFYCTPSSYGWDWNSLPFRDINSIFLPEGELESLLADIDKFLSDKEFYRRSGLPYHRGYLFYGPPGNGKSSLASGLAHHYKRNIYNLPLSAIKDDSQLAKNIKDIQPNSILLLEDIDVFSKSMSRKQEDEGPTLAGLLNALDGIATPPGLLTIMNTNHVEVLDPALVRKGRMDKRLELTAPDEHQARAMFAHIYGEALDVEPKAFESMADLADVMKVAGDNAEDARMGIKA